MITAFNLIGLQHRPATERPGECPGARGIAMGANRLGGVDRN